MSDPIIAANSPTTVSLEEGEDYLWCACGRSSDQPFCDGSHAGTGHTPRSFTAEDGGEATLCRCKRTSTPPYCDGTHASIDDELVGTDGSDGDGAAGEGDEDQDDDSSEDSGPPAARPTDEEPTVAFIHELARGGTDAVGHHGPMVAMGVPRSELPHWDDLQVMTAQLATRPLMDDEPVGTDLVVGPQAARPLELDIPIIVSDMSFGALSEEAKVTLARGAELAGTGICSGEGGMLPAEQEATSRYLYELGSARFGYDDDQLTRVQAFHFKAGQAAKTGTGGHLPARKNVGRIAEVRDLEEGTEAVSPATFPDLRTVDDFRREADRVRELTGGIPIGFKLSANHVEEDVAFALDASADYLILDGRGGGTGAAPAMFRDHISVPTIPALARARRVLDERGASGRVTLFVTGGLRVPIDFVKALALGADGVAVANAAIQSIGCVAARICNTNRCPSGVATQDPELRARLDTDAGPQRLATFLTSSVELMQVMARACGHDHLGGFEPRDLATWKEPMARLAGVRYAGAAG